MMNARPGSRVVAGCGLLILAAGLSGGSRADAQEWTRFRGPDGTGVSEAKGIPLECHGASARWTATLPGVGHSSPVVWKDRVFLTFMDEGSEDSRSLACLSLGDGAVVWESRHAFVPHPQHRFNNAAASTPCVDEHRVYVSWTTGQEREVRAFDHDGRELWKSVVGSYVEDHGSAASPVLVEGVLVVPNDHVGGDGSICGLNPESGEVVWRHERAAERTSFSTPFIHHPPDGGEPQVVVAGTPYGLTALDPKSGRLLWESPEGFEQRTVGSPVASGEIVFTASGQGGGGKESLAVVPKKDAPKAELLYRISTGLPYVPTPIAANGLIFLWSDSGVVSCIDAESGREHWRERVSGPAYASPVLIDGKLYGFSKRGEIIVLAADKEFKRLGEGSVDGEINASPAVSGNRLLVRADNKLYCFGTSQDS